MHKDAEEANSFWQECANLNYKVEKLIQLLCSVEWFEKLTTNAMGLYERPTWQIMMEVLKVLEKVLALGCGVRKQEQAGIRDGVPPVFRHGGYL